MPLNVNCRSGHACYREPMQRSGASRRIRLACRCRTPAFQATQLVRCIATVRKFRVCDGRKHPRIQKLFCPGSTPEKSMKAWPGGVQPTSLQCWPRRSDGQVTRCRNLKANIAELRELASRHSVDTATFHKTRFAGCGRQLCA